MGAGIEDAGSAQQRGAGKAFQRGCAQPMQPALCWLRSHKACYREDPCQSALRKIITTLQVTPCTLAEKKPCFIPSANFKKYPAYRQCRDVVAPWDWQFSHHMTSTAYLLVVLQQTLEHVSCCNLLPAEAISFCVQAAQGPEAAQAYLATPGPGVSTARSILSETYLRRLSKLPLDDTEDRSFD